jgi:hypothetical protein
VTFPRAQYRYDSSGVSRVVYSPSAMRIHKLFDLFKDDPICKSIRDFPGPVTPKSWKQTMKYIEQKIDEGEQNVYIHPDQILPWKFLKTYCDYDGHLNDR